MPEAVIVATARTPIGRANKGSLTECRPDDLAGLIIKDVLGKVPSLDPQTVEDVIVGCGQPGGEADRVPAVAQPVRRGSRHGPPDPPEVKPIAGSVHRSLVRRRSLVAGRPTDSSPTRQDRGRLPLRRDAASGNNLPRVSKITSN